ncbi:MAG: hypothetical protein O2816_04620 [Planctomycetota bacterium]|nr:hypothetical protein [Planctomycetota bacterium]
MTPVDPTSRSRVWAVVLCALAVRLAYMGVFALPERLPEQSYAWDWGYEQVAVASAIAAGEGYRDPFQRDAEEFPWAVQESGATAWCGAVYPLVLGALILATDGPNHDTAMALAWLNVLLSASIAAGLWHLGRGLGREALGRWSAWVWALHPLAAYGAVTLAWDSVLVGAGIVWFLVLLLRRTARLDRGELSMARGLVPVGVAFGLLALLNPATLTLAPGGALFLWVRRRNAFLPSLAAVALPAALVLLPWLVRNQVVVGTFSPKANLGVELLVGNNDDADGAFHAWIHPAYNEAEFARFLELGEGAYGRDARGRALAWIRANPGRFAELSAVRARNFWIGLSPFEPLTLRSGRTKERDWQGWLKWTVYCAVGVLALVGMLRHRDAHGGRALLVGTLACYPIVYYMTHVLERYRQPLEPLLVILAVSALRSLRRRT